MMAESRDKTEILVVENEVLIAADLELRLKTLGYSVSGPVTSARRAIELVEQDRPDLVLMDILLEGDLDGIEAAEIIRGRWDIPVVFITAYGDTELLRRSKLTHPFGYILKPFQDRDLRITIEMALYVAEVVAERKNAIQELFMEKERFRTILDNIPVMITFLDRHGNHQYVNRYWEKRVGWSLEEVRKGDMIARLYPDPEYRRFIMENISKSDGKWGDYKTTVRDGSVIDTSWVNVTLVDGSNVGIGLDITERKQVEDELKKSGLIKESTIEILHGINASTSLSDLAQVVTETLRNTLQVEAVGLRLRDGDDYPYYETRGFPEEFVESERYLCAKNKDGQVLRDKIGHPILECMCGHVIMGRFDPSLPFFTEHGSFWSNCTSDLLAKTTEADRQGRTRNRCNGEGYESVALIPLKVGKKTYGLIQLNDFHKDHFTQQDISMAEDIADNIAIAIARQLAENKTRATLKEKDTLLQEIHHRVRNNMQVIISLMKLQADKFTDQKLIDAFQESQSRIYAMAAVHGILYQSENIDNIDISTYLEKLGQTIFRTYKTDDTRIKLFIEIMPIDLKLEQSYPIGLVFNEIISNALKYAFPDGRQGEIKVVSERVAHDGIKLMVSDNGVGFPLDFDWRKSDSLGLQLVKGLVEYQLEGGLHLDTSNGVKWEITFPVNRQ